MCYTLVDLILQGDLMSVCVLIPAYKPEPVLIEQLKRLSSLGYDILVVDDGGGEDYKDIFTKAEEYAVVVHHNKNRGKGAALKTGFGLVRKYFPESKGVVTADADGQHCVEDIEKVAKALEEGASFVLTERELGKNIPARSKVGNDLSRVLFSLFTGRYLYDNQSGLRGFEISHCDWLVRVHGNKYDYEMAVLLHIDKRNIPVTGIKINTIYINENASSHFDPFKDTYRIYKRMFATLLPSSVSSVLYGVITTLALILLPAYYPAVIAISGLCAITAAVVLGRLLIFKKLSRDILVKNVIFAIMRIAFTILVCLLLSFAAFPVWASFILATAIMIPLRMLLPYLLRNTKILNKAFYVSYRQ